MNNMSFKLRLLLCAPALLLLTGVMHADPIFSENFDTTYGSFSLTTAGQFSTINQTNVDVVGSNGDANAQSFAYLCRGPESGNCVDMSGTNGNSAGNLELTTSLNLAAGTYLLSFDLIGSDRGSDTSTQVIFGSYNQTFNLTSDDITSGVVTNALVTVTGGPTQLQFIDLGAADNVGALLDNIQISATPVSATPEPGSLALLATGLLGAGGMLRRKLKA